MTTEPVSNVHAAEHIYCNSIEDESNPTKCKKLLDLCFLKMHFMNCLNTI